MLQSIDINLLIAQDHIREIDLTVISKKQQIPPPLFTDITDNHPLIISSVNPSLPDVNNTLFFTLSFHTESLTLIETKGQKSRTYIYNFNKRFLTLEGRRASEKEFITLGSFLKKIALYILNHEVLYLKDDGSLVSDAPSQELITFFKTHPSLPAIDTYHCHTKNTAALAQRCAHKLQQLSKHLQPATLAGPSLLDKIKAKLLNALNDSNAIVITDSRLKRFDLNMIHSLIITKLKAIYLEKSTQLRNRFEFIFKDTQLTLNDKKANQSMIDWFISKLDKLAQDLKNNKTELFKPV